MPIQVVWDNDAKTIVRWDFDPGWTWDEYREAALLTNEMIGSVSHRVSCIRNLRKTSMPHGGDVLGQWKRTLVAAPDNMGMVIATDADTFLSAMAEIFKRVQRDNAHPITRANTVEEARQMIAERV